RTDHADAHRHEAHLRCVEAVELVAVRNAEELAVEAVAPRVVRALDLLVAGALAVEELRAAVPARVQERAELAARAVAYEHHGRLADHRGREVAGGGDVADVADVDPALPKHGALLDLEDLARRERARRQI